MSENISKLALFFDDQSTNTIVLDKRFEWKIFDDGTWEFKNGLHVATGHIIVAGYSGAHGDPSPNEHGLNLGDMIGVKGGKCWRVKASRITTQFDCWGIAVGWYDDSDATLVLVSGVIKNIGKSWIPGNRVYLPFYGYGNPSQSPKQRADMFPIGLALNQTDLLLVPRLDV